MENSIVKIGKIDLGKLSGPFTKLVEVGAAGCGRLWSPFEIVLKAKAESKARAIKALANHDIAEFQLQSKTRLEYLEAVRQDNLSKIGTHALNALPETVSDEPVEKDWILQFFDHAQYVCDEDMQILWGRILAGETSEPGSFSKRTLQLLKTFEKEDAKAFTAMCSLCFYADNWPCILMNSVTQECLNKITKTNVDYVIHFKTIGLLMNEPGITLIFDENKATTIRYYDENYKFSKVVDRPVPHLRESFTRIRFTAIGYELIKTANAKPCPGYVHSFSESIKQTNGLELVLVTE